MAGTVGVWAIYLLGKDLYSVRVGLIAATITCVNYFHIWYSQEARPYALVFLFAVLSFLFLIRLIKNPNRKNSLGYALFTLLMLYSHYFGLFAGFSQFIIAVVFWVTDRENKRLLFRHYLTSAVIIAVGFLPWLPFLTSMTNIKSFWIAPVSQSFAIDFFFEYFGNSDVLKPFVLLFLVVAIAQLSGKKGKSGSIKKDSYLFGLLICMIWIVASYIVPYIRSVLTIPMIVSRYSIVILPAFLIIISFGIDRINHRLIRGLLLISFCLLSIIDLLYVKKHYTIAHKAQFRELAGFVVADRFFNYPVLCEVTTWQQQYYLKKLGYQSPIIGGRKEDLVDSILKKRSSKYELDGFWMVDGNGAPKPDEFLVKRITSAFVRVKNQDFFGCWAQLYVSSDAINKKGKFIDHHFFESVEPFVLNGDSVVPVWDGEVTAIPIQIKKGKYRINTLMNGTPALSEFPHMKVFINDLVVDSFYASTTFETRTFTYEAVRDAELIIKVIMDNDLVSPETKEDRNAFIKSILFLRIEE